VGAATGARGRQTRLARVGGLQIQPEMSRKEFQQSLIKDLVLYKDEVLLTQTERLKGKWEGGALKKLSGTDEKLQRFNSRGGSPRPTVAQHYRMNLGEKKERKGK